MKLGVHMRTAIGLTKAATEAVRIGCETVQIFAGNPSSWRAGDLDPGDAARFREIVTDGGISPV